ncbi:MAG: YdcF family protein [Cytophagales bacterium]|nr:YdcF family protein [Cytophagales bacterium]
MLIYFKKIITFFIYPFNHILILLFISLIFRKKRKKAAGLALLWIFIFGNGILYEQCFRWWRMPQPTLASLPHTETAVLLGGGGLAPAEDLESIIQHETNTRPRFNIALALYKAKKFDRLLITAGNLNFGGLEARELKRYFVFMGIPAEAIVLEEKARTTAENAIYSEKLMKEKGMDKDILLITDAFHMRRAQKIFENAGFRVTPYAGGYQRKNHTRQWFDYIFPSPHTLDQWDLLMKEFFGWLYFSITH